MRKGFAILCGLGILVLAASPLYAGGIINKNNQSADYMRTLNRSAATDYPDIAVYNPAGIMQRWKTAPMPSSTCCISQGLLERTARGSASSTADKPSIIPGAFAVYKQRPLGRISSPSPFRPAVESSITRMVTHGP